MDRMDVLNGPHSGGNGVVYSFIAFVWLRFPLSGSQKGPSFVIIYNISLYIYRDL